MATATLNTLDTSNNAALKDEADILAFVEAMLRASHNKNAAVFAAMFTPDAAVFNFAPPPAHSGIHIEEKQAWYDGWSMAVDLDAGDFKISVRGDLAFCHGYLRMTGTKNGANYGVDFWMRETLCLERQGRVWKIFHEHTSVPFYMDGALGSASDLQK
jgi:ketosteroid isomerase-like protein